MHTARGQQGHSGIENAEGLESKKVLSSEGAVTLSRRVGLDTQSAFASPPEQEGGALLASPPRRRRGGPAPSSPGSGAAESELPTEEGALIRIIVSADTSRFLDRFTDAVNEGFDAGKVTRSQVLNWIAKRFSESAGHDEIAEIRAAHFDRIAYFEALLKRAKSTGILPPELDAAIQMPSVHSSAAKKRKPLTKNVINGDIGHEDMVA